jgi:integrase
MASLTRLFNDSFSHKKWKKICEDAQLADLKFHDLRKTFGSLLAQNGLEHPSPYLTDKVYMNVGPVLRDATEQLPLSGRL